MAEILGSQLCMESLQSDIQDVQWTVNDVMSRIGPATFTSWKFPDKRSFELDVEQLLEMYAFSQDEPEDNQVAHVALYELLIDRLVLLIQGTAVYLSQVQQTGKAGGESASPSTSVGLASKHFWGQLTNTQTLVQQLQSKNKSNTRRVAELDKELKKYSPQDEGEDDSNCHVPRITDITDGHVLHRKNSRPISVDESNKSSQTVETAFVPCEACEVVQKKLRESGDMIVEVCQSQGLPSCLRKYRPQVAHANWLTYNDVCRWMAEQNKDITRLCKHIDQMSATIEPLKAEVSAFEKETKQAERRAQDSEKELKLEKEAQAAVKRQFETKLKQKEQEHELTLADLHRQKEELLRKHTSLEMELDQRTTWSTQLQQQLQQSEARSQQLDRDLAEKAAIATRLEGAEREARDLRQQLLDARSQLEVATKTLAKEQGKNKSAALHGQQVQAKQESLSGRIEELTQENEDLREEVAGLEEEKHTLQESLQETRLVKEQLQQEKKQQEVIIRNLNEEKSRLEASIQATEEQIHHLESQLGEAKDRERMLIEYPDLNGPVNPNLQGTGDIVLDMQNQVKANTARIQVLEEQNDGLQRSITKVVSMGLGAPAPHRTQHPTGPIPLWQTSNVDNTRNQPPPPQHHHIPSEPAPAVTHKLYTVSHTPVAMPHKTPSHPASDSQQADFFTVGRSPSEAGKDYRRPASAKRGGGTGAGYIPVNATSISAYKQIKKTTGPPRPDVSPGKGKRPPSGSSSQPPLGVGLGRRGSGDEGERPTYVCDNCDKMYTKARDLDIHKSYCTG